MFRTCGLFLCDDNLQKNPGYERGTDPPQTRSIKRWRELLELKLVLQLLPVKEHVFFSVDWTFRHDQEKKWATLARPASRGQASLRDVGRFINKFNGTRSTDKHGLLEQ